MNFKHTLAHRPRRAQRGAASLFVALVLLLGGTIIAFFANRGFIFEQRTSANQYRATKAFELAEAGAEWAIGRLNENMPLQTASSCAVGGAANPTFRVRYANPNAAGAAGCSSTAGCFAPLTTAMPGCRINVDPTTGTVSQTCDCPVGSVAAALGAPANTSTDREEGRFGVRFAAVGGDGGAVEIISRGCVNVVGNTACDPNSLTVQSDATATVRVIVKVVPTVPSGPAATLTAGSFAASAGNLNVFNTYPSGSGITIQAGSAVPTGSGTSAYSLPGTPSLASIVDNDAVLAGLTSAGADNYFSNFFGQTRGHYGMVDPDVIRISGCSAAACGTQVMTAIAGGARNPRFYIDGDVTFDSGNVGGTPIGTAANAITVVATGTMQLAASLTGYGVFVADALTAAPGTGDVATIHGAVITRSFTKQGDGTLNLVYEPTLWNPGSAPAGRLVKVPGSWRDKATAY
jgi:Tfp pilus assembly protein PilX